MPLNSGNPKSGDKGSNYSFEVKTLRLLEAIAAASAGGGGGVTSIIAGTNISINQATGAVTISSTASGNSFTIVEMSANVTAAAWTYYRADSSTASRTITLPTTGTFAAGDEFMVMDADNNAVNNNIILDIATNSQTLQIPVGNIDISGAGALFKYIGAGVWDVRVINVVPSFSRQEEAQMSIEGKTTPTSTGVSEETWVIGPSYANWKLVSAKALHETTGVGADTTMQIRRNGSSLGTLTITAGATVGNLTGLSQALSENDKIDVNVTQVGSTTPGKGLFVVLTFEQ